MEAELYNLNPWWEQKFETKSIIRDDYLARLKNNLESKEIIFLTGLRRVGKTTIMKQLIQELLKTERAENIFFINLDTFLLLRFSIHELIEQYREIHKKSVNDKFYLFIDEITSKEDFEKELKSLYDNENIKIICSSSIATLMKDKKALLTGRTKTIEVMPLTFKEFLKFKNLKILKSDVSKLNAYFKNYLKIGGLPNYVLTEDEEYLTELVESILYKDIISQYNITNERVIKELFVLLCERVGKPLSFNKLSNILGVSVDSVKRYISYFEKAYLFYVVNRYAKSPNENITSPKKIYVGDVGIKNIITGFKDLGSCYENLVYLAIKENKPSYYFENSIEIDFIYKDTLIEAKYDKELEGKQKKLFENFKIKNKILANGVKFFMK